MKLSAIAHRGLLVSTLCLVGCSGEPADTDAPSGGSYSEPVFALSTLVWGDDATTGYVTLSNTLELDDLSLGNAREFPGYTSIGVADGQLLVTNTDTPVIHRFGINDALEWDDRGELSLMNEGVTNCGFFLQYMQRDRMAYAGEFATARMLWDPVAFEVKGSKMDTRLDLVRDELDLFANYNRNYVVFDGPVMRPFSYHDQDWFKWAPDSQIVVYDRDKHTEKSVIDAPCPGLDTITRDERGNLYFSNWEYPALHALTGTGAAPCVARVTPEGALDEAWQTDLKPLTEGRQVVNFRYLRDGKAIAAVFHAEELAQDFDFEAAAADQDAFWEVAPQHHRLWMFDLNAGTAEPVRGLPDEDLPPSYSHAEIDGRFFIMREASDYSKTTVYELSLDGEAAERFQVTGSAYQWLQVR